MEDVTFEGIRGETEERKGQSCTTKESNISKVLFVSKTEGGNQEGFRLLDTLINEMMMIPSHMQLKTILY